MSGMTDPSDVHGARNNLGGKFFTAKVVDNNDPKKQQRVRIQIDNLVEGPTSELPWAIAGTLNGGPNNMALDVPPVGSFVIVILQDGDPLYPIWLGAVQAPFNGSSSITATNYPNRVGRQLDADTFWYFDRTSNELKLSHQGTTVVITASGQVNINAVGTVNITAPTINLN